MNTSSRAARLIPPLSAEQLGLFRVVFGTALLLVFLDEAVFLIDPLPRDLHRNYSPLADIAWVHWLAASESALTTSAIVVYLSLAAFIIGVHTRLAFFVVSVGFFIHATVVLQSSGVHNLGVLAVTLLGLLIVPWGDGLSVDSRFARSRPRPARSRYEYGFAIWLPGFTMGLAFLAAAVAKLTFGGLAWITDGAVKYHFVEDAFNAPTSLGLWVASHQAAAVACSLGAVAIEALFVLNVLNPSAAWRAAFGLGGAVLLSGFYLFQGVFWPGWSLLLLVFLPWQSFNPRATPSANESRTLPWQYAAIVLVLLIAQAYASATRTEVEPLLTWFPMYARTWESTEDFDAAREERMSRFSFWIGDREITDWVEKIGSRDALVAAATRAGQSELLESQRSSLKFLRAQYEANFGSSNTRVEIHRDRQAFNWTSGQFVQVEHDALLGIVDLAEF